MGGTVPLTVYVSKRGAKSVNAIRIKRPAAHSALRHVPRAGATHQEPAGGVRCSRIHFYMHSAHSADLFVAGQQSSCSGGWKLWMRRWNKHRQIVGLFLITSISSICPYSIVHASPPYRLRVIRRDEHTTEPVSPFVGVEVVSVCGAILDRHRTERL